MDLHDQGLKDNSKAMYEAKFLRSIRHANSGGSVFVCGRVSAEMYKKCVYRVDIKLDQLGVVEECQCECAAGMGPEPYCKHVGLVLYALTKAKDGIITKETRTQTLQTFHQAKKYNGSPVKIKNMIFHSSNSPMVNLKEYDPRPEDLHNIPGYKDYFRSIWLNSSVTSPAICQLYSPANVYGINNDHDYLIASPKELFLQNISVTKVTEEERIKVELRSRDYKTNDALDNLSSVQFEPQIKT